MAQAFLEYCYTIVTVVLLFYFLHNSLHAKRSLSKEWKWWFCFGFVFGVFSFSWLYTTYPLPWLPAGIVQFAGIFMLHMIISFLCGIAYSIISLSFLKFVTKSAQIFIFAGIAALSEIFRSLLISTLYVGNGGDIGLHWTASTLGNALSTTPFVELAYFGGVYSLSFVIAFIVYIATLRDTKKFFIYSSSLLFILYCVHVFVPVHGPEKITTISVVTTNFSSPKTTDGLAQKIAEQYVLLHILTKSLASNPSDIIVYPEDARYITYTNDARKKELEPYFNKTLFIDGTTEMLGGKLSNATLFYQPGKNISTRNKTFLFPFNEYVPLILHPIFVLIIGKDNLENYISKHTYTKGNTADTYQYNGLRIATLICSEILSFGTIEKIKKGAPHIIFYQAQLNAFHQNPLFEAHLRSFSKVAAAEFRVPFITSSNNTPSYIISPYGNIVDIIPLSFGVHKYRAFGRSITKVY